MPTTNPQTRERYQTFLMFNIQLTQSLMPLCCKKKKISKTQLQYKLQVYHTRLLGKIFAISNCSDLSKVLQSIFRERPSYAYWCGPLAWWGRSRDPLVSSLCYGHDMHTGARLFLILMSSGANVHHTYWLDFDSQPENL